MAGGAPTGMGEPWSQARLFCTPGWGAIPLPGRPLSAPAPQDSSLLAQEVGSLLGERTTVAGTSKAERAGHLERPCPVLKLLLWDGSRAVLRTPRVREALSRRGSQGVHRSETLARLPPLPAVLGL